MTSSFIQISVLELEGCFLNVVVPESLAQLVNILSSQSDLCYLRLTRNDFSSRVIRSHLSDLAHCKGLRYLCLTTPSDMYISKFGFLFADTLFAFVILSDIKSFILKIFGIFFYLSNFAGRVKKNNAIVMIPMI